MVMKRLANAFIQTLFFGKYNDITNGSRFTGATSSKGRRC
jgi:hypothetical protein